MIAAIKIKIMGGTDIAAAYYDCNDVSIRLGGVSVETSFNGVNMFYHHQSLIEWESEYNKGIYRLSNERSRR